MTAALKDLQIKDAASRSLITFAGDLLTHPQRRQVNRPAEQKCLLQCKR